jgi:indole-3-glycerol phosphate synthase
MMDILNEIVAHKRVEVDEYKRFISPTKLYNLVEQEMEHEDSLPISMCEALMKSDTGIISEFKRKSPSKGWIKQDGSPEIIPLNYQKNGATALSILTDHDYFGGCDEYIQIARQVGVTIPILYKNFVIDEYQLFLARHCGASAVLLIAANLKKAECKILLNTAHELGMEVLLEMHNDKDFDYIDLEPDMYGINNRNLGTFHTDVQNSFRMASRLPQNACLVSESGIDSPETVNSLKLAGFKGFLMGECFMKAEDPGMALKDFIAALNRQKL